MIRGLRDKNLHTWIRGWVRHLATRPLDRLREAPFLGPRHVLFALCDHYEPLWGRASASVGEARVRAWEEGYPELARSYRDADGRPPRHTYFFPGEQYAPSYLERLARLSSAGLGEVEFHLHHDNDTGAKLRLDLARYLGEFAGHGHLSRDPDGRLRYAFIHGNWCLANGRRDRRLCGVDEELPLLFETGCYADFTFPSAPDECQPDIVNQIYWPEGDLSRARSYEQGTRARVGDRRHDRLLMIQGPLALAARPGRLIPRIEAAALTGVDPCTPSRIRTWVHQGIHIAGRPEWIFVKVHTHGAPEKNAVSLLGDGGHAMHRELTTRYNDGRRFVLHYVTAREMYNLAMAAIDGRSGNPDDYRDYELPPPPAANAPRAALSAATATRS